MIYRTRDAEAGRWWGAAPLLPLKSRSRGGQKCPFYAVHLELPFIITSVVSQSKKNNFSNFNIKYDFQERFSNSLSFSYTLTFTIIVWQSAQVPSLKILSPPCPNVAPASLYRTMRMMIKTVTATRKTQPTMCYLNTQRRSFWGRGGVTPSKVSNNKQIRIDIRKYFL